MNFEEQYLALKARIDRSLLDAVKEPRPRSLYQPLKYVLAGGGKRIRPVLVLLACEAVGGDSEAAVHAGAGIEILHNFTLVHDDIMDHAGSRRGRPTVHTKWDENTAILVGDELLALAYRILLKTNSPRIREIASVFTEGVVEVCEGQAYDKEFETKVTVSVDEYLLMIRKKTGKMVAVATELGALIGDATAEEIIALRRYGESVGRAFQIQDDLLDVIADEKKFGKTIGGDLKEGKKTFLLLAALGKAKGVDKTLLKTLIRNKGVSGRKVREFRRIYEETGAIEQAKNAVHADIREAKQELDRLKPSPARDMLFWFTDMLLNRTY
jgi:geranylgeranyl diphosphate synthase, type II